MMRLHHTNIRVVDPKPEVAFYRALGFELYGCMRLGALYTLYLSLPGDSCGIELTVNESPDSTWSRDMGAGHIAIVVDDLDATLARLAACGVQPVVAPMHPAGRADVRVSFLQGPSGYRVELIDGGDFQPRQEELPQSLGHYDR
jgi:lactoylglutathione lyase